VLEPAGAEFWLNRLRRLQGQLGELHDLQVAAELIAALPGARPVAGELRARAAVLEALCQRQWQRNFGPRVRQRLLAWAKEAS
jgi:CHAD domain-containing protein